VTLWHIVILASIACVLLKLAGYLIPPAVLQRPAAARTADLVTVAMLAALVVVIVAAGVAAGIRAFV
jgi:hypothetical protein